MGSFAVVALAVLFLLEYSVFADHAFAAKAWCLIFASAVPRAWSTFAVLSFRPLPGSSYERMFSGGVPRGCQTAAGAELLLLVVCPVVIFGRAGISALAGLVGSVLTTAWIRRDLGGMSGDVSGAGITVGELCALAALSLL